MDLGVNIDHIATIRQARGTNYPSVLDAATLAEQAGADSITLHLREDRRHMQDKDLYELKPLLKTKMNLNFYSGIDNLLDETYSLGPSSPFYLSLFLNHFLHSKLQTFLL